MKKIVSLLLCMVIVFALMPVVSFNASGYKSLMAENINHVYLSEAYAYDYYSFIPMKAGLYNFYSIGEEDPFIYVYDEFGNEIRYDDDGGVENNFNCFVSLEQYQVYYIVVSAYYEKYAQFDFYAENVGRYAENYIETDNEGRIILGSGDRKEIIKFIPEQNGYYEFYSCGVEDMKYDDPYAIVYDSEYNLIDKDNDTGEGNNFSLSCYLSGGETYYFEATRLYGLWDFPYTIGIRKTEVVVKTKVINEPQNITYLDGFDEESIDYSGLELELTYSDGTKTKWKYDDNKEILGTSIELMVLKDDEGKYFVYIIAGFSDCKMYLNVVDNPIEKLVLNSAPIREYVMWNGEFGYRDGMFYILSPEDLTGISFTAYYKDGTTRVFTHEDVENDSLFAGYRYDVYPIRLSRGGIYKVKLRFFEHELTYDVLVHDSIEPKGDIDMDKEVSVMDATLIQMHIAGIAHLDEAQIFACDVNEDSSTNIADVTHLQRFIARIIDKI